MTVFLFKRMCGVIGLVVVLFAEVRGIEPYQPTHPDPVLESWRWRSFPELNGKGLFSLTESVDGAMWFGHDRGVERYDGVHWTSYTTTDGIYGAPVRALCATKDGSIYAGTEQGLSRFQEGVWTRAFPLAETHPWPVYNITEASDGSLWVATGWGALHVSAAQVVLYTTEDIAPAVRAIDPDLEIEVMPAPVRPWPQGTGIAVTVGHQRLDQGHVHWVVSALAADGPGERAGIALGDHIVAIDGQAIPGDMDGPAGTDVRLSVLRGAQSDSLHFVVTRREIQGGFQSAAVFDVFEDRDGRIWIGLFDGELLVLDVNGSNKWRLYADADGLEVGYEPQMAQTADGTIWCISNSSSHGMNRFDGQRWMVDHIDHAQWFPVHSAIVALPDGALWVGGLEMQVYRNGEWRWYRGGEIPTSYHRKRFHVASDGALWIALEGREALRLDLSDRRWQTYKGLHFQGETPDGAQWFIAREQVLEGSFDGVVRRNTNGEWVRFTEEDGLMNQPSGILMARDGEVWVGGGHDSVSAIARFMPGRGGTPSQWSLQSYPKLSWNIRSNAFLEANNGDLWFSSELRWRTDAGQEGGLMQIDPDRFESGDAVYHNPWDEFVAYGMGQTTDSTIWAGSFRLKYFDGQWKNVTEPKGLTSYIHYILGTPDGNMWVGTRAYGVFHRVNGMWRQYAADEGLLSNTVVSVLPVSEDDVWIATAEGVHRFDGTVWAPLSAPLNTFAGWQGSIRKSRDGAIWVQTVRDEFYESIRYMPDSGTPETEITFSVDEVAQSGNTVVNWKGIDPWRDTHEADLQFAWRINGGDWSDFSPDLEKVFFSLESGPHLFEVKSRDHDLNEDPTPAVARFVVVAPVWERPWFVVLIIVFAALIGLQTTRVIRRDRALVVSNEELARSRDEAEAANRAKSTFLANMSHEIRTPMNAILGYAQILDRSDNLTPQQQNAIETIGQSGEHLLGLINSVLDISKIEAGREELTTVDFDLHQMIETMGTMFAMRCQQKGLVWQLHNGVPEGMVRGDEGKLRQVLINLLGNAVKFTQEGGVSLRVEKLRADGYRFDICDTGPGVAQEKQDEIFEPFHQDEAGVRMGGTGLGLAISHHYVNLMAGTIAVDSPYDPSKRPGANGQILAGELGACFSFQLTLPKGVEKSSLTEVDWSRVDHLAQGQKAYALVVDDVKENRDILEQILKDIGVTVQTAENGEQALACIDQDMPDIVFMDMRMPVMNGPQTLQRIYETHGSDATRIIAVTASVFDHQRQQYLDVGFDDFIDKPLRAEQIYKSLVEHLGVSFIFREEIQAGTDADWSEVHLDAEYRENLLLAVEQHSLTRLRQGIADLESLGEDMQPLVVHLNALTQQMDMEGIRDVLEKITSGE